MRILIIILTVISCGLAIAQGFNERGTWYAVEGRTLVASERHSFGPRDISDREDELNIFIHGTTEDTLKLKLDIYGMMSSQSSDTTKSKLVKTTTYTGVDSNLAIAYSATVDSLYSHLFFKLSNSHTGHSATVDVWIYSKPRDLTFIRAFRAQ